jgi:hypothetical protein
MIAMTRMPKIRPILVVAALFALMVVPMAGARSFDSLAVHPAGESWIGIALHWVEGLVSPQRPGNSGSKVPHTKTTDTTQGSGCIDPTGHPKPYCL